VIPPALEDVERGCALLTSCDDVPYPSGAPKSVDLCVPRLMRELSSTKAMAWSMSARRQVVEARTCDAVRKRLLRGAAPNVCAGIMRAGICDSNGRAVTCVDGVPHDVLDCRRAGNTCAVVGERAYCSLGPCEDGGNASTTARCSADGKQLQTCTRGESFSFPCYTSADRGLFAPEALRRDNGRALRRWPRDPHRLRRGEPLVRSDSRFAHRRRLRAPRSRARRRV